MNITLDHRSVTAYRQWARWMLGLEFAPDGASTRYADALFRSCPSTIRHVARALADAILPVAWGSAERRLYRGLRLEAVSLPGTQLPPHPAYDSLPALSFSEELAVACYFADPGPCGMPVVPILNTVTGKPGLPPHGYIVTGIFGAGDVLFHWQYPLRAPDLFGASDEDLKTIVAQREVTIDNCGARQLEVAPLARAGGEYLASRYGTSPDARGAA